VAHSAASTVRLFPAHRNKALRSDEVLRVMRARRVMRTISRSFIARMPHQTRIASGALLWFDDVARRRLFFPPSVGGDEVKLDSTPRPRSTKPHTSRRSLQQHENADCVPPLPRRSYRSRRSRDQPHPGVEGCCPLVCGTAGGLSLAPRTPGAAACSTTPRLRRRFAASERAI
jgi:hypothetical protein